MSINADINELKELDTELKRLRKHVRRLSDQKRKCESRILEYLDVNDQPGVKMDGTVIMAEQKQIRKYQRQNDKLSRGMQVLSKYGITTSDTLNEVIEAMRGPSEVKACVRMIKK
jgi:predicted transcriptional regulator